VNDVLGSVVGGLLAVLVPGYVSLLGFSLLRRI